MSYLCALQAGREASYGAGATTAREYPIIDEAFDFPDPDVDGEGWYSGAEGPLDTAITRPVLAGSGSLTIQPMSKGFGLLAEELMGAATHTLVSGTTYQTLLTFADTLPSAQWQKQLPERDGSTQVQDYVGCVVTSWDLTMESKGTLALAVNYDVRDPSGTGSADALVKITGTRFVFAGFSVQSGTITAPTTTTLGSGNAALAGVRGVKVTVDHKLDVDSPFNANNAGLKDQPMPSDLRSIEVELTRELVDETLETAFRNGTNVGLVLNFEAESLSTGKATLQIVLPSLRAKGPLPKVGKERILTTPYRLVAYKNASFAQRMWMVLRTSDAALA